MNYDFDEIIDRHGTNALKWEVFPEDVLPLWVADMDFAVAPPIINRIKKRLENPIFGYSLDNSELIETIQKRMLERYNWEIDTESIVLVPGIVSGINFTCRAVCEPGESVIFQTPVYPPFYEAPLNNKLESCLSSLTFDSKAKIYNIDFDEFTGRIKENTRLFILSNPHNPVGRVFTADELQKLGEICCRNDIVICSDEIHSDIIYSGNKHIPIASINPEIADRTITFIAPSKTFNIPGLSCSAAIIQNPELRKKFAQSLHGFSNGVTFIAQEAGSAAYSECSDWLNQMNHYLEANRDFLFDTIAREMPSIGTNQIQATYLAWLDCSRAGIEGNPAKFFAENAKVGLNDGAAFGCGYEKFVRLNFGTPRRILEEALDRMANALHKN